VVYRALGDFDASIRDLDQALSLDEDYEWAYFQRGLTYLALGNSEASNHDMDRAIQLVNASLGKKPGDQERVLIRAVYMLAAGYSEQVESIWLEITGNLVSQPAIWSAIVDLSDYLSVRPYDPLGQRLFKVLKENYQS
jgi:tetratricopeptide (TPR) repeat protein